MIYTVKFREDAAKEWARLDSTIFRDNLLRN